MSLKLELIGVEFPIGYSKDLVMAFIYTYDKINYKEKLHLKNADYQMVLQHKKFLKCDMSNVIKTDVEWGDDVSDNTIGIPPIIMKLKAKLYFSTENPQLTLKKFAQRGSKITGTPTGRPKGQKNKKCMDCMANCTHKNQINIDLSGVQEETFQINTMSTISTQIE